MTTDSLPATMSVLSGRTIKLRQFEIADVTPRYIAWLNDKTVNAFSQRAGIHTTAEDARAYINSLGAGEMILAIEESELGHVGNIKFGPVDWANRRCDISILIGETECWGRGVGAQAVYLVTKHLFEEFALNRVDAGTGNPAFSRLVEKLDWRLEGVLKQRVKLQDQYVDWYLFALLKSEFKQRLEFEAAG